MLQRGLEGDERFIGMPGVWSLLSELLPEAHQAIVELSLSKATSSASFSSSGSHHGNTSQQQPRSSMTETGMTLPGCTATASSLSSPGLTASLSSSCAAVMKKCPACRSFVKGKIHFPGNVATQCHNQPICKMQEHNTILQQRAQQQQPTLTRTQIRATCQDQFAALLASSHPRCGAASPARHLAAVSPLMRHLWAAAVVAPARWFVLAPVRFSEACCGAGGVVVVVAGTTVAVQLPTWFPRLGRAVLNKVDPDEALLQSRSDDGDGTACFILVDVPLSHSTQILQVLSVTKLNFPEGLNPVCAPLILRKSGGDPVFATHSKSNEINLVEASTGVKSHISSECTWPSLSQVSASVFCTWHCGTKSCNLWDCNNSAQPLWTVRSTSEGLCLKHVVGGSGFLFAVSDKEIQVMEALSGSVLMSIEPAFGTHIMVISSH
ncbi:hypothetical protein Pelo_3175 [Pelomyxa schiedti]|nr:hypothetical protein Pelo_3175 [Pelomyxa schiedti]